MGDTQFLHPLCGADLRTIVTILRRYGPPSIKRAPQMALIAGAALGRAPLNALEAWSTARRIRRSAPMAAPIFILGHWRSGTTHLYNLLSQSGDYGYVSPIATGLPWNLLGLARMFRPLLERGLPEHRFIDNVAVTPESPQEDEAAIANMCATSFYHALYFPKNFRRAFFEGVFFDGVSERDIEHWRRAMALFLNKVTIDQGGKRLIVKNPAYTARVAQLRAIWPDAQFIHIRRNPFVVFQSMRNFHYKLCAALGLQTTIPEGVDAVVLETFSRIMETLEWETADLPCERYIDIRFEDLEAAPTDVVGQIFDQLSLPGRSDAEAAIGRYLGTLSDYRKNAYRFDPADLAQVADAWAPHIARGGYEAPR